MLGLNTLVFRYAPVAQPYAMCLFTLTLAFYCCVRSPDRAGAGAAFGAGLFAGAAAASSLLSAIAAPVPARLDGRPQSPRVATGQGRGVFSRQPAIPFLPILRLFWLGPRQTWFNLIQYHASFRRLYWPDTSEHDIEVLTSWMVKAPALALLALAGFGLWSARRQSGWPEALRSELALCAWLSAALAAESALAHPTFAQYFLLTVPFLAILGAAGLARGNSGAYRRRDPRHLALQGHLRRSGLCDLGGLSADRSQDRTGDPPGALTFANEPIYFLTRRTPPPGYELYYTHKLQLPAADRALSHLLTEDGLREQLKAGRFASRVFVHNEADFGAARLYPQHETVDDCEVYWDFGGERRSGPSRSDVLVEEDRIAVGSTAIKLAGPVVDSSACCRNSTPCALSCRWSSRTSVKEGSFWALLSQPGLKVRMFFSNMPWNRPITWSPFFRISQFWRRRRRRR